MALDTYDGLKAEIADWLNRADLTTQIPTFIRLLEARANRVLRTHDMVKRSTATTADGYFTVPSDWKETISLTRTSGQFPPLEFVNIEKAEQIRAIPSNNGLPPQLYTHVDGKFLLVPAPSDPVEIELVYRGAIPALSADNQTNWLLTRSPDLYLFGSLASAEPYLKNDERLPVWKSQADQAVVDMAYEAERAAFPQGKLTQKFRTFG